MRTLTSLTIVLTFLALSSPASATPQDQANSLSGEIMSPFCPGVTLHECPSAEAVAMRNRIVEWFAMGETRAQIMDRLEDEYGSSIRAVPPTEGAGLGAWLLPITAVIFGLGVAAFLLRRWTRGSGPEKAPTGVAPVDRARLESELTALRGPQ